jgi:hypothetical protein
MTAQKRPLANKHSLNGGSESRPGRIEVMDEPFDLNITDDEQPKPNHAASSDYKAEDNGRSRLFGERHSRTRTKKESTPKAIIAIPNRKGQFKEPLTKLYAGVGTMMMIADPICGTAILSSAEKCAETLDQLAYENEAARRAIWMLTQTSTLGMVLVAHMPIIMAVLMHHVPRMQEAFGAMGANMMEEFLKQTAPGTETQ